MSDVIFVTGRSGNPNKTTYRAHWGADATCLWRCSGGMMGLSAGSALPGAACKGGTVSLGGNFDIATVCAGGLFHLGDVAHRGVLLAAQPAPRGVGPDRPERSSCHRGGRGHQPSRP